MDLRRTTLAIAMLVTAFATSLIPSGGAAAQPEAAGQRSVVTANDVSAAAYPPWEGRRLRNGMHYFQCLDANRNTWWGNNSTVQLWECNGWSNQQWWANWNHAAVTEVRTPGFPAGPVGGRCLDAWDYGTGFPFRVSTWHCNGSLQQKWRVMEQAPRNVVLINMKYGLCLDVPTAVPPFGGGRVGLWPCHNGDNQEWSTHY
jgi:hypothetical protein